MMISSVKLQALLPVMMTFTDCSEIYFYFLKMYFPVRIGDDWFAPPVFTRELICCMTGPVVSSQRDNPGIQRHRPSPACVGS